MNIKTEINGAVGIATLNRPEALNALNTAGERSASSRQAAMSRSVSAAVFLET